MAEIRQWSTDEDAPATARMEVTEGSREVVATTSSVGESVSLSTETTPSIGRGRNTIEARTESEREFIERMRENHTGSIALDLQKRETAARAPTGHELTKKLLDLEIPKENLLIVHC